MIRFVLAVFLCFVCLVPVSAQDLKRFQFAEPHMGTRFQLTLYAADEDSAKKAATAAFTRVKELDDIMTDYRSTSELMKLCAKAGGDPVPVSPELFFVLDKAVAVSRLSGGAFDVTISPVVRLWRIARRTQRLPDPDKLAEARALVGWQNIQLDARARTVKLTKKGMQLDLGGIGKGYTVDEVHAVLRRHGITRALVAAGGDIRASDAPPDSEGWTVAIYPLEPASDKPAPQFVLKNAAVSTSGDLQQYVEIKGVRYSHIVDPRTGLGLVGRMSATVIAPTGIQADSLTKVLAVLGEDKGLPILESLEGVSGRLARKTEEGIQVSTSKRFPQAK